MKGVQAGKIETGVVVAGGFRERELFRFGLIAAKGARVGGKDKFDIAAFRDFEEVVEFPFVGSQIKCLGRTIGLLVSC